MNDYTKAVIALFIFLIFLSATLKRVNLNRIIRFRQVLPVFFSPVYAVGTAVYCYRYHNEVAGRLIFIPDNMIVFFLNILMIAGFIIFKFVLMLDSRWFFRFNSRVSFFASFFYEYDEKENNWFVRQKFTGMRTAVTVLFWTFTVLSAAYLAFYSLLPETSLWKITLYPAAVIIVFCEIVCYMGGYSKPEYLDLVYGDDAEAYQYGSYHLMRGILEKLFPEPLLMSFTADNYSNKPGSRYYLDDLLRSDDETDRKVAQYFTGLNRDSGFYDTDLIRAVNRMSHGENILIFNPFYNDLTEYMLLPLLEHLLNDETVLVICGRESSVEDIKRWLGGMIGDYTRSSNFFTIDELDSSRKECNIGILKFSELYDSNLFAENKAFFEQIGFVLLVEPSRMMPAAQLSLSIAADKMRKFRTPVYCILDHYMDGLSDTLSHVLQINLTEIVALKSAGGVYSVMDWKASGDFRRQQLFHNEMHYLGNGIEIAASALKNQIKHVTWAANDNAPIRDIRWIVRPYYSAITRYANIENTQESLDKRISFETNLWGSEKENEAFVIVEDEENNLFTSILPYLTRGERQVFVNVLSQNYLLRDYMRYNRKIFMTDPKAIVRIAPEFVKTERNTVLQLIIKMAAEPIPEEEIIHELKLMGYETPDPRLLFNSLIEKYLDIHESIVETRTVTDTAEDLSPVQVCYYSISKEMFEKHFSKTLRTAWFVVEDEKFDTTTIDARQFEHITQMAMPDQLLIHDGKLYKVEKVTSELGCILHRAADQYYDRLFYHQVRTYSFFAEEELISTRKIGDLTISMEDCSFNVTTSGYLVMKDNHDLRTAKYINLSEEPTIINYQREYHRKHVLRLQLPETDDDIRFTAALLMQEIFRTLFPNVWDYIAVLCTRQEDEEGMLDKYVYRIDGNIDNESIYIVEDSSMDLGILEVIDTNIGRILEILADYLDWHMTKIKEGSYSDPAPKEIELPEELRVKQNFLRRIGRQIRRIFEADALKQEKKTPEEVRKINRETKEGKVSDQAEKESEKNDRGQSAATDGTSEHVKGAGNQEENPVSPDLLDEEDVITVEGEDVIESDLLPDDLDLLIKAPLSRYQKECYLKFGFDEIIGKLKIEPLSQYLTVRGYAKGALFKARTRMPFADAEEDENAANHCDFCGKAISGVSYERLADGRVRCAECSSSAINSIEEFREIFMHTKILMESLFNISFLVSIGIESTDARTIARRRNAVFKPTSGVTPRATGYAQVNKGVYSIVIENGSPRLMCIETIAHELTHIWQYINWDRKQMELLYDNSDALLVVYEGMASWVEIQMMYAVGETAFAKMKEHQLELREDEYGLGFRLYREKYGMRDDGRIPTYTPFGQMPPL